MSSNISKRPRSRARKPRTDNDVEMNAPLEDFSWSSFECDDDVKVLDKGTVIGPFDDNYPFESSEMLNNERDYFRLLLSKIANSHMSDEWITEVKPKTQYSDEQLLCGYVLSLFIFGAECPKSEEDILRTGIFKNYAIKYLKGCGTIDDIITKYSELSKNQFFRIIKDMTLQDFYKREMNQKFFDLYPNLYHRGDEGKIGVVIKIYDTDDKEKIKEVTIYENELASCFGVFWHLDYGNEMRYMANDPLYFQLNMEKGVSEMQLFLRIKTDFSDTFYSVSKGEEYYEAYSSCIEDAKSFDELLQGIMKLQGNPG